MVFDGVETPLFDPIWDWNWKIGFFYEEKTREKSALIILERRTTSLSVEPPSAPLVFDKDADRSRRRAIIITMVRGNAKKLAQEKNAKKQAEKTTAKSNLGKPNQSLQMKCSVCMAQMKNAKQMRDHFESKHPKLPLPKECEE